MIPYLIAIFVALMALDAMSTVQIIKRGGSELNPFLRILMGMIGVQDALLIVKVVSMVIVLAAVQTGYINEENAWILGALDAVYTGVVGWNVKVIMDKRDAVA